MDLPCGRETVLVVEDDPLVRQIVVRQLTSLGYTVLEATDGPSALEVLSSPRDIDLVFTDLVMPNGMTGRDVAEAAHRIRPGVKLLFTSGYGQDIERNRLEPPIPLLPKPHRRTTLAQTVRAVLDGQAPDAAGSASNAR